MGDRFSSIGLFDGAPDNLALYFMSATTGAGTGFYRFTPSGRLHLVVDGVNVQSWGATGQQFNVGGLVMARSTVAATGTTNANAAAAGHGFTSVTAADDTVGVILPVMVPGEIAIIKSTVSNKILKVYPFSGAAINALTATTGAISLASGPTIAMFICDSTTQIYSLPLLPS